MTGVVFIWWVRCIIPESSLLLNMLVNTVLRCIVGYEAYLDEAVIWSSTWADHISRLLSRLVAVNLALNQGGSYLHIFGLWKQVCPVGPKIEVFDDPST